MVREAHEGRKDVIPMPEREQRCKCGTLEPSLLQKDA